MLRIAVIGSTETVIGFKALGLETWPAENAAQAKEALKQLTAEGMDFLKQQNPNYDRYLIQYAAIMISTLPILIALPFFIKKLEKGMVLGGVKG